jgi:signal transduction histidine kinase
VLRFALYAGVVLLAGGLAIAWLVNRDVADRAERALERQGRAVIEQNLQTHLRADDFGRPVSPARRARLDELFRKIILIPGVVGGRLVSRDGTITYGARHALIGTDATPTVGFERALEGSVSRQVLQTTTWRGQQDLKVLRVFVPVRLSGHGRPVGAIELDQDYRAVSVSIGDARGRLALILVLTLLALYVSLFPILHRVTRQLETRNRRLAQNAAEHARLLDAERAARGEAEAVQQLLTEQNDRLRELDRLKDEFVSLVSHELRTPLTSIRGYLELLLDDENLTDEQRRFIAVADRNSERLLEVVSDLLFLAQIEAGKIAIELGPVDLNDVVDECIESSSPVAAAKGIELRVHAQALPNLRGDRARLGQMLDNLVSNALKFTPAGGKVDVRLSADADGVVLEVEDTGLGIPSEEQAQLFERFFRSSRASENAIPGTGLGLTITKAIVERHGGRIELESAENVGTTVRVHLPLAEDRETAESSVAA